MALAPVPTALSLRTLATMRGQVTTLFLVALLGATPTPPLLPLLEAGRLQLNDHTIQGGEFTNRTRGKAVME